MDSFVKLVSDARLFIIDDAGIVFSESQQSLYTFNTAATFIWCQLEEGLSLEETFGEYGETFSCGNDEAKRQVSEVIEQWKTLGLLKGFEKTSIRHASIRDPKPNRDPVTNLPPYADPTVFQQYDYLLLNSHFRVRFTSPGQVQWIHPVLAHLEIHDSTHVDSYIDIIGVGSEFHIYRDKSPVAFVSTIDALAPWVKGLIMQAAVNNHAYFLFIHAGVVEKDGGCLLLPGSSGSGKSTLTAALIQSGFHYMSDEIALLQETSFHVRSTPVALCAKSTGWDVLRPYYPELDKLSVHHREDDRLVRYLPPPLSSLYHTMDHSFPVRLIIFPRYETEAKTEIRAIDKITALKKMMDDCVAITQRLTMENVQALIQWMKGIPCYRLTMSSLEEAVECIRNIRLKE